MLYVPSKVAFQTERRQMILMDLLIKTKRNTRNLISRKIKKILFICCLCFKELFSVCFVLKLFYRFLKEFSRKTKFIFWVLKCFIWKGFLREIWSFNVLMAMVRGQEKLKKFQFRYKFKCRHKYDINLNKLWIEIIISKLDFKKNLLLNVKDTPQF